MELKNIDRKKLLITASFIVVAIIIFSVAFRLEFTRFWYETILLGKCPVSDGVSVFEGEQIEAIFNGDLGDENIISIVESYGLDVWDLYRSPFDDNNDAIVYIHVPKGKEDMWICILKESESDNILKLSRIETRSLLH